LLRDFALPRLADTTDEVVVLEWLVNVGDAVTAGQPLLEVETDKAQTEVVAPYAGVVAQIKAQVDDLCQTGTVVCTIEVEDGP